MTQYPPEQCRPVTIQTGDSPVTMTVRGAEPPGPQVNAALTDIVAAAKRIFAARPHLPDHCPDCGYSTQSGIHHRRCQPKGTVMTDPPLHNPHAVRIEVLGTLELAAAAADVQARIYRADRDPGAATHYDQVATITRLLHGHVIRHNLIEHLADAADDDSFHSVHGEARYAWHTVRLYRGQHPLDPEECDLVEETHPAQCAMLPPGAVCWFADDPRHDWWPTGVYGVFRMRPVFWLTGGSPDLAEGFDLQQLDETTGTWNQWRPLTSTPGDPTEATA